MSPLSSRAKRSETGLLTPDNCVVAFIDLQPRMLAGVANADRQCVLNNNVMLARAARLFGVPTLLSCVDTPAAQADTLAPLQAVLQAQAPLTRTTMNSWEDPAFVDRVVGLGRTRLVLAGLWTETCVALPAIEALEDGYEVYIVEDCCGDISALAHENAMQRMIDAGARPVTALSVMLAWQRHRALADTGDTVRETAPAHYPSPQPVYRGNAGQAAE